jgi:hypothetical protein
MPGGSGAMYQLAAKGKEDLNIYGFKDPTPFKSVYRKYSHFSMQDHNIPFNTTINFGKKCKVTIPNLGDLIGNTLFINIKFPKIKISYKNTIDIEIINLKNSDGTIVEKINNIEPFKQFLLNTIDINNIFANNKDISKINNVFGVVNLYHNFLMFNITNNSITYNFTEKLYYSNTLGYLEYIFFKQKELMKDKSIINSNTIQNNIIDSLKDSLLFIENTQNIDVKNNINLELNVFHEYYYKISQNLTFEENQYSTKYYTCNIAGEIPSTIIYDLYGLISTTDTLLGNILEVNANDLKLQLPKLLYNISTYTMIFICNKTCTINTTATLQINDKITNGDLELTITSISGNTINFSLSKIPTSDIVISNTFKTTTNITVTISGFNYRFYTISSTLSNNANIENDIVLFFQNLSTTEFQSLFITMMEKSLKIPFWFYFQFYSKFFTNTNNTTNTNNMISRIINMDRTTYDLDTSKSTLVQDETKYNEFSKNFNTLYLNSNNTNFSTITLTSIGTKFTNLILSNLSEYKNQILDDYSTNLATYLLTGTPNSLKTLFKTIAVYSTTSASSENVIYKVDITPSNGLFNSSAKVIIHSNYGDLLISAQNINTLVTVEAGQTVNDIKITIRLQQVIITLFNKKYDTDLLTTSEYNTIKILNNATHYSFDNDGAYIKLNIFSRSEFLDTVFYTTDTLINDEALYVSSKVHYFTNFLLCDYIQYLRNNFKSKFFDKITYLHQIDIETKCLELFVKIRNKYMITYLGMSELSTTGRLYLSEINDYYDLYDPENIMNSLIDRDNLTEIQLKSMLDSTIISNTNYKYSKGVTIKDIYKNSGNLQFPNIIIMYGTNITSVQDSELESNDYYVINRSTSRIYVSSKHDPGDSVTIASNIVYTKKINTLQYMGYDYQINEKLSVGTTTDSIDYNISKVQTYVFIDKNLTNNITEFKYKLGSVYFAKSGLTYVGQVTTNTIKTIYKITDSITFINNGYHINSFDDLSSLKNDSTIFSGYISDTTDSVIIDQMIIDSIDSYTLSNTDLDVIDGSYYTGSPGDNLNLLTKSQVLALFKIYIKSIKEAYTYYYCIKNYETSNTSYLNFLRNFTEKLENIGYTIDNVNRYIEEKLGFKLKTYQTTFSDNLTRNNFQTNQHLIDNSIDLYNIINNKITSYKTHYSETNTIFNIEKLIINDKYYYSNYNLINNLDSILYNGNTLISKYYSPNNTILKNIYTPIFSDQRKFIIQTMDFLKNILLKKSIYDYVFLFSIYGFMPNVKLEEIIYTILNNQAYSSSNYSASLLSTEETNSVEFNTLFADKAIYKYKNTLMSYDEYTQAKIVMDKFAVSGTILAQEVLIREKYNSLPTICIDTIRNKTSTYGNTTYKQLQINFEQSDGNTQYIQNITFSNNNNFIAFNETHLTNFNSNTPYIKIYIGNNIYVKKVTYSTDLYITDIPYDNTNTINVSYGYHILKNIIATTKEIYDLTNSISNDSVSKINNEYKRTYQLPVSLTLVGDQNNLLNLSLSRNFNKDKYLIINKLLLLIVHHIKKNNTTEISSDITYNNTNTSISVSDISNDLLMFFGDKMSGFGYHDGFELIMSQLNKLEEKSSYNCNLYKLGLNKYDIGYKKFFDDSTLIDEGTDTTLSDITYDNLTNSYGYDYSINSVTIDSSGIYYMYNIQLNNYQNISIEDSLILKNNTTQISVNKVISFSDNRINLLTTTYITNPTNILNYSYTKLTNTTQMLEPIVNDSITINNINYILLENTGLTLIIKSNYDTNVSTSNVKLKDWYFTDITEDINTNSIVVVDNVLVDVRKINGIVLLKLSSNNATSIKYGIKSFINSTNVSTLNFDPQPMLELFYNDSVLYNKLNNLDNILFKENLGLTQTNGKDLILKIRKLFFNQLTTLNEKKWYYDTHDLDYDLKSTSQGLNIYTPQQTALITKQYNTLYNYREYVKKSTAIRNRDTTPMFKFTENYALNLIKNIKLKLGDYVISEYDSDYLYLANKLFHKKQTGFKKMVGNDSNEYIESNEGNFYIPIPWMFKKIPFPLIASPYTKLTFEVELRDLESLIITDDNNVNKIISKKPKLFLLANYYYLEYDQRQLFAEYRHEYLVEQVNRIIVPRPRFDLKILDLVKIPIGLGNPTKDIIFFFKSKSDINNKLLNKYSITAGTINKSKFIVTNSIIAKQVYQENIYTNPIKEAKIKINGKNRMNYYEGTYFNDVVPYQYYKNQVDVGVNVYSFAIHPTNDFPSGSINLSYVEDMNLFIKLHTSSDGNIHIYTRNYNILRVMSGQSGIIYLN